jgi:hypothetical protein
MEEDRLTISTCDYCYFRKTETGGWKWYCDAYHPEVIAWYERQEQVRQTQAAAEEEAFWCREY